MSWYILDELGNKLLNITSFKLEQVKDKPATLMWTLRWYQVVEPKRHRNKEKYPGYKLLRYVQLGHNFLRN